MLQRNGRSFFGTRTGGYGAREATVAEAPPIVNAEGRLAFLRRVYAWMFAGILATVMGGAIAVKSGIAEQMLYWGWFPRILLLVAWIAGPFLLTRVRHVPTWNVVSFALYGLFTGIVMSTMIFLAIFLAERNGAAGGTYLLQAGGLTLLAFGSISAYAYFSKRDFSFLRSFLTVGAIVLLGAILISFFVQSTGLHLIISVFGVLLMSGFVLYDTQKVLKTFPDGEHVQGAMTLYLDFVVLFIYILQLVLLLAGGGRRD